MSTTRKYSWTLKLGTFLFLASQLMASDHALEFGHEPHEHDGHTCVALLFDDQTIVASNGCLLVTKLLLSDAVAVVPNAPESADNVALPPAIGPPLSI